MTDTQAPAAAGSDFRTFAIVCYALYFLGLANGFTALIGVIIAYIKRSDARGTIWESHFENLITVFWTALIGALAGAILVFAFGLGVLILAVVFVWYLYRNIKGIIAAIENRAFV